MSAHPYRTAAEAPTDATDKHDEPSKPKRLEHLLDAYVCVLRRTAEDVHALRQSLPRKEEK